MLSTFTLVQTSSLVTETKKYPSSHSEVLEFVHSGKKCLTSTTSRSWAKEECFLSIFSNREKKPASTAKFCCHIPLGLHTHGSHIQSFNQPWIGPPLPSFILTLLKSLAGVCVCAEENPIFNSVPSYPWFQVSTGGPGTYYPQIAACTLLK